MFYSLINAARAKVHNSRAGFTLIELLVVIVLLGILMAIAVPTFQNAQQRGQATSAQAELETAYSIAQGEYSYNANGTYPSTADLISKLEESEDEIQFSELALTGGAGGGLFVLEAAIAQNANTSAQVTTPAPAGSGVGSPADLDSDDFESIFTGLAANPGTVGVQVFNFNGTPAGAATQSDGDDEVTFSTTAPSENPDNVAAGSPGNALVLARQDVSRNTVTWWLVSNRDEALPDAYVGAFYGSDRDGFSWRGNE